MSGSEFAALVAGDMVAPRAAVAADGAAVAIVTVTAAPCLGLKRGPRWSCHDGGGRGVAGIPAACPLAPVGGRADGTVERHPGLYHLPSDGRGRTCQPWDKAIQHRPGLARGDGRGGSVFELARDIGKVDRHRGSGGRGRGRPAHRGVLRNRDNGLPGAGATYRQGVGKPRHCIRRHRVLAAGRRSRDHRWAWRRFRARPQHQSGRGDKACLWTPWWKGMSGQRGAQHPAHTRVPSTGSWTRGSWKAEPRALLEAFGIAGGCRLRPGPSRFA